MLSALIAPFKYISPGTSSTEDEDSLSKPLHTFSVSHWQTECGTEISVTCIINYFWEAGGRNGLFDYKWVF